VLFLTRLSLLEDIVVLFVIFGVYGEEKEVEEEEEEEVEVVAEVERMSSSIHVPGPSFSPPVA
jgi:hypothetical protein